VSATPVSSPVRCRKGGVRHHLQTTARNRAQPAGGRALLRRLAPGLVHFEREGSDAAPRRTKAESGSSPFHRRQLGSFPSARRRHDTDGDRRWLACLPAGAEKLRLAHPIEAAQSSFSAADLILGIPAMSAHTYLVTFPTLMRVSISLQLTQLAVQRAYAEFAERTPSSSLRRSRLGPGERCRALHLDEAWGTTCFPSSGGGN
jgi:hypothetical protein